MLFLHELQLQRLHGFLILGLLTTSPILLSCFLHLFLVPLPRLLLGTLLNFQFWVQVLFPWPGALYRMYFVFLIFWWTFYLSIRFFILAKGRQSSSHHTTWLFKTWMILGWLWPLGMLTLHHSFTNLMVLSLLMTQDHVMWYMQIQLVDFGMNILGMSIIDTFSSWALRH